MRSLRLSLTVYFLALSAAALGTAMAFVYRIATQTQEDKRRTTAQLIEAQYNERCQKEKDGRDRDLLIQATTLARLTQFQFDYAQVWTRELHALGLLSSSLAPSGYMLAPAWAEQGNWRSPLFQELHGRTFITAIKLSNSDLLRQVDGQVAEYFQIDNGSGSTYHSASMNNRSFDFDIQKFYPDQLVYWQWDDTSLDPETPVRRVVFKASRARRVGIDSVFRQGLPRPSTSSGAPGAREGPFRPMIVVQCAYDAHKRDAALAAFREQRDQELADLATSTDRELDGLHRRLLLLGTATFAAAVFGCWALVRLGLSPLRRLSEAVSRVSLRDFRLPFDEPRLPQELRPIVERLSGTLAQLRRAFAREKQATADLSHELRTPLAALMATIELALRKPRDGEDYRELLAECQHSAQQMHGMVERLLTLARLDAGADRVRPQQTDVAVLATQAAALVRPLAQAHGIQLDVHLSEPEHCHAFTDPDKLREVLLNLLHNAVQYNRPVEEGGGLVVLSVQCTSDSLVLEVRDTGVGIAPEGREHLFERFYRGDPSRSGDGLHAGLGLALAKEYIDLLGGQIEVESTLGKGSTFRVILPGNRITGRSAPLAAAPASIEVG
jgi:signal transduction histidine kinase